MKTAFDGLISRIDIAEERISKLENILIETFKMEKKKDWEKQNIQELWDNYKNIYNIYKMRIPGELSVRDRTNIFKNYDLRISQN